MGEFVLSAASPSPTTAANGIATSDAAPLHLLLLPLPTWSHVRPLCALAGKLVSYQRNMVLTFLVASCHIETTEAELARQFLPGEDSEPLKRIRTISMFKSEDKTMFQLFEPFATSYPAIYETLYQSKPLTCPTTGRSFAGLPPPSAIIMSFFAIDQLHATRKVSGTSVPVLAWVPGGATHVLRKYGPEHLGGLGDLSPKIDAEAARTGRSIAEVGDEMFGRTEGKEVSIGGMPPMYDHELFPQVLPSRSTGKAAIAKGGASFLRSCDGVIISSSGIYEPGPVGALESWLASISKPLYGVGPLLPAAYGSGMAGDYKGGGQSNMKEFLDRALVERGERSVFFISFGTMSWPTSTDYVEEVIEAFLEKATPFIFSLASPLAKLSQGIYDKVDASGLGILTKWSPQHFILNHPATGWFVSHCGHGSVIESLHSGIPLVCWPFEADQPTAAKHLTENLNVAFELIEVRTGLGMKPILSTGRTPKGSREAVGVEIREVLDQCHSKIGQEKRKNVLRIQMEFAEAWEDDGRAKRALQRLVDDIELHEKVTERR